MTYKNGYKVVFEVAADGKRTFYAAKSTEYPTRDADGKILDRKIVEFEDVNFAGKTIYEFEGEFYVSAGSLPAYTADGRPEETETKLDFSAIFVEDEDDEATEDEVVEDEDEVVEDEIVEDEEPEDEGETEVED